MRAPTSTRRSPGCSADRSGRRARTSIDRRANARLASRGNRKGRVTMLWAIYCVDGPDTAKARAERSEEHTSELQSLMRISYAVFCLKKKNKKQNDTKPYIQ